MVINTVQLSAAKPVVVLLSVRLVVALLVLLLVVMVMPAGSLIIDAVYVLKI